MKIKQWDKRKEKKARFKRSLARAKKRGMVVYGGFIPLNFTLLELEEDIRKYKEFEEFFARLPTPIRKEP